MEQRIISSIKTSDAPLSLILDGSTSKGNTHYLGEIDDKSNTIKLVTLIMAFINFSLLDSNHGEEYGC